jgi:hypothetical protein
MLCWYPSFVETMYQHLLHNYIAMERSARLETTNKDSAHNLVEQLNQLVGDVGDAAE